MQPASSKTHVQAWRFTQVHVPLQSKLQAQEFAIIKNDLLAPVQTLYDSPYVN